MFKKLCKLFLVGVLAISLAACTKDKFKAGTYTGTAEGFSGDITVEVTLDDSKTITNVEVVSSTESVDIGEKALPILVAAVLAANTTDVDVVTTATVTSDAFLQACNEAIKQSGINAEDLKKVDGDTAMTDETIDVDVVVVGAGGAGMSAAITAAQAGKSVLIVEKAPIVGGNSSRATGGMNAAKTDYQDTNEFGNEGVAIEKTIANAKEKYPELNELTSIVEAQYNEYKANPVGYFDSVELFMLDTLVGGKNVNNYDLVETMATDSADAIAWLETIGINLNNVAQFGGASVKRIHRPVNDEGKTVSVGSYIIPLLEENCNELGITILTETTADGIIMTDGVATGITAKSASVNYTVNAKAVVIATGGFGANLEMVAQLKPELDGFITTNASTITGDGINMATNVGANTVDMEQIQIHPTVHQETSALITEGLRGDGAILVNQEGVRFCDEVGTRDAVSAAELAQTGGYAYLIVDQKMVDASAVIQGYITKGLTVQGETVEELAEAMGTDAEALVATIDAWNACVEAGVDEEFGRTSFANPLDTGSYYAIKIAPGVHHTMGGIEINTNAEVLSTDGSVIPGLFAAGEVTGGVHGANRLGGNAVADIIVFGRIAGSSAAEYAK